MSSSLAGAGLVRFMIKPRMIGADHSGFFDGTRSRGRTGTTLLSLVFETNASTDSAIRACVR